MTDWNEYLGRKREAVLSRRGRVKKGAAMEKLRPIRNLLERDNEIIGRVNYLQPELKEATAA